MKLILIPKPDASTPKLIHDILQRFSIVIGFEEYILFAFVCINDDDYLD